MTRRFPLVALTSLLLCMSLPAAARAPTGSISGIVRNTKTNTAMVNVLVSAELLPDGDGFSHSTHTAADGSYIITGLSAGDYAVESYPTNAANLYAVYGGQQRDQCRGTPVAVIESANTPNIDLAMMPTGFIEGTITQANGVTPLAHAIVQSFDAVTKCMHYATMTDTQGHYRQASGDGLALIRAGMSGYISEFYGDRYALDLAPAIPLVAGQTTTNWNIALDQASQVIGKVTAADGVTPIPYVTVSTFALGFDPVSTCADEQGNYTLESAPSQAIFALGAGFSDLCEPLTGYKPSYRGGADDPGQSDFLVAPSTGQPFSGINIRLDAVLAGSKPADESSRIIPSTPTSPAGATKMPPASPVSSGTVTISGTLYDALTGLPMSDYPTVQIINASNNSPAAYISPGADGKYIAILNQAGMYRVAAPIPYSYLWAYYGGTLDYAAATSLNLTLGDSVQGIDITIPRTGEITGTVTDSDTNALLADQCVDQFIDPSGSLFVTSTGVHGAYWQWGVPLGVPTYMRARGSDCTQGTTPDSDEYWQESPDFASATAITLTNAARVQTDIDFTLEPVETSAALNSTVTLQGRPTPPNASWAIPLYVVITPSAGGSAVFDQTILTDNSGGFSVAGIAPGSYRVWVKGDHMLANAQTAILSAGNNTVDVGVLREGDADGSNVVTIADFSILAITFGKAFGANGYDARADFNGDGTITIADFSLLASNFGQSGATP